MRFATVADRAVGLLCGACLALSAAATLVLVALGSADVVGTQLLGRAVPSAIELQESFAGVLIFTGIVAAQRYRAHIGVDLVTARLAGVAQYVADAAALLCTVAALGLVTMQAYALAARSVRAGEHSPGYLGFPIYPFKVIACIACAVATLEAVRQLVHVLAGDRSVVEPAYEKELLS